MAKSATVERPSNKGNTGKLAYKFIYSIVFSCFLLSGISGLIYEVIWTRMLTSIFGGTTLAVSTVLTAFLGGLALGSFIGGKFIDKFKKPLLAYGILELAIGIYGLLVPVIFSEPFLAPVWQNLVQAFESVQYLSYLVRFLICIVLLAIPTVMMGATLPVLSRYLTNVRSDMVAFNVGILYTINTVGAIVGTFLAGFILLPSIGVNASVYIAAALNLILAGAVIALAQLNKAVQIDTPNIEAVKKEQNESVEKLISQSQDDIPADVVKLSMIAFAVSGFVALVFEVVWTRTLTLVVGSSTYAFTTMLTTFLVGLALGAAIMTKLQEKIERPVFWAGAVLCGIAVSGFITSCFFNELPWMFLSRAQKLPSDPATSWILLSITRFFISSAIMFVPTLLSGMMFPLIIRIYAARPDHIGESVGKLYSLNTLGCIIGSFASGFVLIPLFGVFGSGIQTTSKFAILVALCMGLYLISKDLKINPSLNEKQRQISTSWIYLSAAFGLLANIFLMPQWDKSIMTTGVAIYHALSYKTLTKKQFFEMFKTSNATEKIKFYKEGLVTVVTITGGDGSNTTLLKNNGKVDAGVPTDGDGPSQADMVTQVLLGQLPLLLHKTGNPENVLVVGLGSGCTTGSVVRYPTIKSVKVCEIEKAVIDGDKYFEPPEGKNPLGGNGSPLNPDRNPLAERVKAINTDGRNYLLTTDEKFDIIISQPADPWVQGASALFTKEFWTQGSKHLKKNGLFCEWIQLYSINPEYLGVLVNTFKESFGTYDKNGKKISDGYTYLFRPGLAGELLLIGSNDPIEMDIKEIDKRIKTSFVAKGKAGSLTVRTEDDLARISIHDATDIASQFILGDDQVKGFVEQLTKRVPRLAKLPLKERVNTDDNVIIEFDAPKKLHLFYAPIPDNIASIGQATDGNVEQYFTNYGDTDQEKASFFAKLAIEHTQKASGGLKDIKDDPNLKIADHLAKKALQIAPSVDAYVANYTVSSAFGNEIEAESYFDKATGAPTFTANDFVTLGQVRATKGDLEGSISAFRSATQKDPSLSKAWSKLGESLFNKAQKDNSRATFDESLKSFKKARELDPFNVEAWSGEGNVYFSYASRFREFQNIPLAEQAYKESFKADLNYWPSRLNYAKILYGQGPSRYNEALNEFSHITRRLNPRNPEARYLSGKILQQQGNLYYAFQFYQTAVQVGGLPSEQQDDAIVQIQQIQQQLQSQNQGQQFTGKQEQVNDSDKEDKGKNIVIPKGGPSDIEPTKEEKTIKKILNLDGDIKGEPSNNEESDKPSLEEDKAGKESLKPSQESAN